MWDADPRRLRRDVATAEHGVAEGADGIGRRADRERDLGDARVEPVARGGVHPLHRRPASDDALDGLADRQRRPDAGRDQQRVAAGHPERLHPAVVDDRVHLRDLRCVHADMDLRCVGPRAHPDVAVLRHLAPELRPQRHLAAGDPVPLLLELRRGVRVVVAVRRGVDRRDVDGVVVDADLGQREALDPGHPVEVADASHHAVAEGSLAEDQHVGGVQRGTERTGVADRMGRVERRRRGRVRRVAGSGSWARSTTWRGSGGRSDEPLPQDARSSVATTTVAHAIPGRPRAMVEG